MIKNSKTALANTRFFLSRVEFLYRRWLQFLIFILFRYFGHEHIHYYFSFTFSLFFEIYNARRNIYIFRFRGIVFSPRHILASSSLCLLFAFSSHFQCLTILAFLIVIRYVIFQYCLYHTNIFILQPQISDCILPLLFYISPSASAFLITITDD